MCRPEGRRYIKMRHYLCPAILDFGFHRRLDYRITPSGLEGSDIRCSLKAPAERLRFRLGVNGSRQDSRQRNRLPYRRGARGYEALLGEAQALI